MGEGDANCFQDLWQKTDNYLSDSAKSTRLRRQKVRERRKRVKAVNVRRKREKMIAVLNIRNSPNRARSTEKIYIHKDIGKTRIFCV